MTRWGMLIDQTRCVGCYACTIACKVENSTPRGIWYAPVYEKEVGHYPTAKRVFLPTLCNQCEDAPCMTACPTKAISRRDDGIIEVNQDVCCGSRACVAACPYGAMHFYDEPGGEFGEELTPLEELFKDKYQKGTVQKCTFCSHRIDAGVYTPACVEACPTSCRIFGDLEDPDSNISQYIRRKNAHQPKPEAGTDPSVWYVS